MDLIPLSYLDTTLLLLFTMAGAAFTTGVGMGGGIIVIGAMSIFLPIQALIPIHAIIQGGSGVYRSFVFRKTFLKKFVVIFILGSLLGYWIGINFLITLHDAVLKFILGLGIILLSFTPNFKLNQVSKLSIFTCGAITGFLTLFIGVMGPILGTFLSSFLKDRYFIVGTLAWCMTFQNLGKALIFTKTGFDYQPWILLITFLIAASYIGVTVGKKLLDINNNEWFQKILKVTALILGGKLIVESLYFYSS